MITFDEECLKPQSCDICFVWHSKTRAFFLHNVKHENLNTRVNHSKK